MFQGGVADWVERARSHGWHDDWLHQSDDLLWLSHDEEEGCLKEPAMSVWEDRAGVGRRLRGWVDRLDGLSTVIGGARLEGFLQRDMDTFYLAHALAATSGPCRKAEAGVCVEEGVGDGLTPEDKAFHEAWSGRGVTPGLVDLERRADWRGRLKVAAVVCVYDDSTFLREVVLDLVAQLDHVLVLVSALPWNGDVRGDNTHTMRTLADLMADATLSRDKLSVVTGRWRSEAEQRQVRVDDEEEGGGLGLIKEDSVLG